MDPSRDKLVKARERVWGESRRVGVVGGGREVFGPPVLKFWANSLSEGRIGAGHEDSRWDVGARGRGSLEDQGEAGQSIHEGDCEVCQSVNREVVSERGGGDWGVPVWGEVEGLGEEAPREGQG